MNYTTLAQAILLPIAVHIDVLIRGGRNSSFLIFLMVSVPLSLAVVFLLSLTKVLETSEDRYILGTLLALASFGLMSLIPGAILFSL